MQNTKKNVAELKYIYNLKKETDDSDIIIYNNVRMISTLYNNIYVVQFLFLWL